MHTKLFDTKDITHYRDNINKAAAALRKGELVAFPTETVYGIGANARDRDAVATLYDVKHRPRGKEFAHLISSPDDIRNLVENVPVYATILMKEFWPGPLTIVFSNTGKSDIGIRFPGHKVAQDLVRQAGVPLVATSANVSGNPPATDAQKVREYFSGKVAIILDGGPSTIKTPSTVVKVSQDSCVVLREGAIPEERIINCLSTKVEVN
ncbi:MAG: L-threonylcarbamoyladenylate synthase [Candidatus Brocadiales bacterium]|nr:threonylcarbamoyl-AMP synthase [Candidatus Bathyanammoxibius sp.]MCQ4574146.1 L-threonylcarbamoyladenylate synthase [Candidatus Bathyanammoxibius amoris]